MLVRLFKDMPLFVYDTISEGFISQSAWGNTPTGIPNDYVIRYLKNRYTNKERFIAGFVNPILNIVNECAAPDRLVKLVNTLNMFATQYDSVKPWSYAEAFQIGSLDFKSMVFGSIRVPEMIAELGHKRIATAGRPVKHKQYSKSGEFLGYKEYDVIFETHRVDGFKLGLREYVYAVKCWCTTTNNEHWLWIDEQYKSDPLEAIAHTFFIHENLIPHIKELKRQGDVLLVELTSEVEPRGNMVSLNKDQYFELLTAQS